MEQSYQRWPFLPPTMRTPEQNEQWWAHCFLPVLPVENFAQAGGHKAIISAPGNGGTTALAYLVRQGRERAFIIRYVIQNWPHGPRPKVLGKGHISQIMALVAAEVARVLEIEPERYMALQANRIQQEFLCWLLEKHLGRRTLVRLAYRLQQAKQMSLSVPEQFQEVYASDEDEADVWGQIGEAAELVQALGFVAITLLLDMNQSEMSDLLPDVISLFSRMDLFEHPGWSVCAALPQTDMTRQQALQVVNGRFYPIHLEYSDEEIQQIVSHHLQVATDGRVSTLEMVADNTLLAHIRYEIQMLYGSQSLRGWLDWTETLMHLAETTYEFEDKSLSEADAATFAYFKRHVLLRLDEKKQGIWRGPQFVPLENQPYELMKKLFELRGKPSSDVLFDIAGSVANLNTITNRLRSKIEPVKGKTNIYLKNSRDQGYWLENFIV